MRESCTAVIARNDVWQGLAASEPYETAWADEAVIFLRNLESAGAPEEARAWVQISADGMRWVDEGTSFPVPARGEVSFCRIRNFGGYLRVKTILPPGASFKALLSIALKG
jgi:hypothetical protein